ncbi:MAG: hypothetical protein GKC04_07930, partial [Methanomicrobiales archaeon]|nr:hypothetical protein [Methanomicrobiales archaeon]
MIESLVGSLLMGWETLFGILPTSCGKKKLQALGIEPELHLVATDCGIAKRGMEDPDYAEIDRLAAA